MSNHFLVEAWGPLRHTLLMQHRWFKVALILSVTVGGVALLSRMVPDERPIFTEEQKQLPSFSHCAHPREGHFSYQSYFIVHRAFVSQYQLREKTTEIVDQHIRYLRGYFHFLNDKSFRLIPTDLTNMRIKSVRPVTYGQEIRVDMEPLFDRTRFPSEFQQEFVVKKDDPAIRIDYEAELNAIYCSHRATDKSQIDLSIVLPRDPFLAYWYVPQNQRVMISDGVDQKKLNPCVSDRFVKEYKAEHYWYFWRPEQANCQELLDTHLAVMRSRVPLSLKSFNQQSSHFAFLHQRPLIDMSIIFGLIENGDVVGSIERILEEFQKHKVFTDDHRLALTKLEDLRPIFTSETDVSSKALLDFLYRASAFVDIKHISLIKKEGSVEVTVKGAISGQQKLTMHLYLGDVRSESPGNHYDFLARSFKGSDFIFYGGHSNHGENMNLMNFGKRLGLDEKGLRSLINSRSYQFFGNLSCYATSYHFNEYLNLRDQTRGFTSDMLLMGSEGYSVMQPLAVLEMLKNKKQYIDIGKYSGPEDFFIMNRR